MTSTGPYPSIVTTSAPAETDAPTNPRRPLASCSVSLVHSRRPRPGRPKTHSSSSNDSGTLNRPRRSLEEREGTDSLLSLQALGGKPSFGESSSAEKWFEKANNEVGDNSALFADDDPPFFMRNSSSSETPPDAREQLQTLLNQDEHAPSLPSLARLLRPGTDGSSADDFRNVIDDLTIENKKLKRRLKKYEKLHDAHLKDEKLFEVRIHGLPPEKRRELEETLRSFASSLGPTGASDFPWCGYAGLMPTLNRGKTASSQVSLHNTDSAYVSMSGSGQGSSAGSRNDRKPNMTPIQSSRQKNIPTYLYDIPEGLLPRQNPPTMSERVKKKLVVRRMEQIFAGKGAAVGGHQQHLQQEEVSQSAARADMSAVGATGQRARKEGTREAHIMEGETEDPLELGQDKEKSSPDDMNDKRQPTKIPTQRQQDFTEPLPSHTNGQRPTRPIDLDPHRAQVPVENIRYMRHLGFSPPDPESSKSPEDGHGWIYLNFLINMAQLHTINVTSDFVRQALGEYSNKFEVSSDGCKVRWKSRSSISRRSRSGEGYSDNRHGDDTLDGQSPRKRPKLSHGKGALSSSQKFGSASQRLQAENGKHVYTPLFYRDGTDDADDSSSEQEEHSTSSPLLVPVLNASSGMTSSGIRTNSCPQNMSIKKEKHDDGPIIFYNNARFCTDLSGDRRGSGNQNPPFYTLANAWPIGKPQNVADGAFEQRGPLSKASELPEPIDLTDNPIPESMEVSFPQHSPFMSGSSEEQKPFELEVTGIGGVWPSDNFAISVESRHALVEEQQTLDISADAASKMLPPRFACILRGSRHKLKAGPTVWKEVIAAKIQDLPPSQLPPALSFMSFDEGYMDEDESDVDEGMSDVPGSPVEFPPSAALQRVDIPYDSSEDEEDDDESDDQDESEGEVDLLATARKIDPEAVRQKEREYDANMAERLAEEISAGSSAATAGGGSGIPSLASGDEVQRARSYGRTKPANLKRPRTSDSMAVQSVHSSDSGDDDSETSDISS